MLFLSAGLFRHVYVAKSIALFVSSMIAIIYICTMALDVGDDPIHQSSETKNGFDIDDNGIAHHFGVKGFLFAYRTFGSLDEILSLFVFYELYMCTCHMEARTQSILRFAKKMTIAFTVNLFLHGPEIFCAFILEFWWDHFMVILDPAASLINLSCTGTVIYLGVKILLALRKSEDFRIANSQLAQSTKKNNHLTLFVGIVVAGQTLKFFSRLVVLIVMPILLNKLNHCINDFDDSIPQKKECDVYWRLVSYMAPYSNIRWGSILELLFVVALMVRKNFSSKFDAIRKKFLAACTSRDGESSN